MNISLFQALDAYALTKCDLRSYNTVLVKIRAIKRHINDMPINELTTLIVDQHVLQRRTSGAAPQTIKHDIIYLRGAWQWAKNRNYAASDIDWPSIKIRNARTRSLSKCEEVRLLTELEPKNPKYLANLHSNWLLSRTLKIRQDNYDLVILLIDTGARYGEIAGLSWDRVDLDTGLVDIQRTKTHSQSVLVLSQRCMKVLKRRYERRTQAHWVFTDTTGTKPRGHVTNGIKNALKAAQIKDFRVHDFRHTLATRLVRNGLTLQEVSHVLGQKSIHSAQRYAHLSHICTAKKATHVVDSINNI